MPTEGSSSSKMAAAKLSKILKVEMDATDDEDKPLYQTLYQKELAKEEKKKEAKRKTALEGYEAISKTALTQSDTMVKRDLVTYNSLPIFFPNVEISVIDNALVVHQIDAKVVLVYDVLSGSMQPVGLPLPLTIRGLPVLRTTRGLHEGEDINADASTSGQGSHGYTEDCQEAIESGVDGRGSGQQMCKMNDTLQSVREVYGPGWVFLTPDLIIDRNAGLLWRLHLDLEAFAATCSDACALISFLQRRKADPSKAKLLSLVVMRSMIVERSPLPWIASAMDIFTVTFHSLQRVSGKLSSAPAHPGSRTPGKGTPPAFTSNLQTTPGTYSTPQSSPRQIAPAASARPDVRIDGRHGFRKSPNIGGEPAISPHFMGVNRTPPSGSQHADGSCATSRNERVARTGVSSPEDWVSVDQEDHEQEQEQDQFAHGVFLGSMEMPATESSREAEGAAGESGRAEDCGLVRGKEKLTEGVVQLEHEGGGGNMWQLSTMIAQDSIQCELGGAIYTGEIVPDETDSDRIVRGAVTTRRAVHQVQNSGQVQESSSSSEWKVLMSLSPAVSPEEMTSVMFAIEEELVVDSSFLVAIALEYLRR
ncbi:hypothetical protein CBR_g32657 [Chara braunii]|uniref:Uncharacterized protein n=1 Tax=Chara braunii TaxID=69332 RepID=A0A388LHF7_CHABU|nr:hypothetical protein CBR_g32657 [Chara braunii]|eukprot:GBG81663.1 hypothetical protein CBR_g32657 [Chara braunii]